MQLLTKAGDLVIAEMSYHEWCSILELCGVNTSNTDPEGHEEPFDATRLLYKKKALGEYGKRLHALLADFIASSEVSP